MSGQGIQTYNQFTRELTFTGPFVSTGVQLKFIQGVLAAPTYAGGSGLSYRTGAILAFDGSGDFINCDPAGIAPQTIPVAILVDDRLEYNDENGDYINGTGSVVGQTVNAVFTEFRIKAGILFATDPALADVPTAMASFNANFDATTDTYGKF